MLKDYNQAKALREYIIQYFTFCYNSAYTVHKNTKYSAGQQPKELILNYISTTQELNNK